MSEAEPIKTNVPEFSVSELSFSLKKTIEENFGRVRVRGELSRVSIAGSGHMYSSLKDDNAVIDAVCWKGTMSKLSVKPEEGMEVICTGRLTTYPKSSKYQLVIESMELAGEGALLKMLEERRKKLTKEGLFDEDRKKPLPFLPEVIGVVTSPTGAVIRDILHRLQDRFPRHVLVWPVLVQGDGASAQITAAIEGFNLIDGTTTPRPDVLIIARGGGSLEDLMAFNEENVVRAAAASQIPLISAVGHETDTTLIDYAADLRAPTPTGAAEMAVPVRANLHAQVLEDHQRLLSGITRQITESRHRLDAQAAKLGDPSKLLETQTQRLDHIGEKMAGIFARYLGEKKNTLTETAAALPTPHAILQNNNLILERWTEQLTTRGSKLLKDPTQRLTHAEQMLEAYSFENVLSRGYAVVRTGDGAVISDASQTKTGQDIQIQFRKNKTVDAIIGKGGKVAKPKKPKPSKDNSQQSLF